jgi:hypothetical protein
VCVCVCDNDITIGHDLGLAGDKVAGSNSLIRYPMTEFRYKLSKCTTTITTAAGLFLYVVGATPTATWRWSTYIGVCVCCHLLPCLPALVLQIWLFLLHVIIWLRDGQARRRSMKMRRR